MNSGGWVVGMVKVNWMKSGEMGGYDDGWVVVENI